MKNVKVILVGVALCATIFANQRIDALGGDSGFWPGDKDNINTFPSAVNDHGFVEVDGVGEVGGTGDVTANIVWGDATKWGMSYDESDSDTWFNLVWGSGDMGITASLVSSSDGDDDTEDATGFSFGYGQNFSWGDLGVNLSSVGDAVDYSVNWRGDLGFWAFDTAKFGMDMSDDGIGETSMNLDFDMFTHMDAGGADVLFGLGFGYGSNDWSDVGAVTAAGTAAIPVGCTAGTVFDAGVSEFECINTYGGTWNDEHVDATDDYVAAAAQIVGGGATSMTLPSATIAVEADMTDWATFRCFVNTNYTVAATNDGADNDYAADGYTGSSTTYGFGLGFNWGGLTADMSISENVLQDPVSNMTGYEDGTLTSAGVTLTYSF